MSLPKLDWTSIEQEALEYLQQLLRIDTTNPPGHEQKALEWLQNILRKEGIDCTFYPSAPERGNLLACYSGSGELKPLLLASHIDVVAAEASKWRYPPFSGEIAENCVWGRGAVDMKTMVIYELMAVLLSKRLRLRYKRDIKFLVVCDEEAGGKWGMGWMVEHHPAELEAEFCLNEVGGFSIALKKRVYPIQVGEKGLLWLKVQAKGEPGHASMPGEGNAIFRLLHALEKIRRRPWALRFHPITRGQIRAFVQASSPLEGFVLRLLSFPFVGKKILRLLPEEQRRYFTALLSDTIAPTILQAGTQNNVLPSQARAILDCRTLPQTEHSSFIQQLKQQLGKQIELETLLDMPSVCFPIQEEVFNVLKSVLQSRDPEAVVCPSLTVGFTDAKHLAKLGIPTYGFFPMKLPKGFEFAKLFHGHDERIPLESFRWGLRTFFEAVYRLAAPQTAV
ncbi:MAG: M20/M25/M40 family metallo-hydrolase [Planctomycetota bacterium]|nr:MAG: M20/M25/M40 family metallo-hydrolase [Planctomycetota bacterium]